MISKLYLSTILAPYYKALTIIICSFCLLSCDNEPQSKAEKNPLKELANNSGNYERPSKNNVIRFPQAHAPKKAYRQEWWYLTANLTTESGEQLGAQWTLFRRAVGDKHWYFAHAALGGSKHHESAYRDGREELGNVVIQSAPFKASISDWHWRSAAEFLPASLRFGNGRMAGALKNAAQIAGNSMTEGGWYVDLQLSEEQQFYLQGEKGFSQKHHTLDISSHYYSQPFIKVSGKVFWQGQWHTVTGDAWLDREWGTQLLADDQQGWDWFSLRLDDQTALMVYRIRSIKQDYLYGSIMKRDGSIKVLGENDISVIRLDNEAKGNVYPQSFKLLIPEEKVDITVSVVNDQQVMRFGIEYFEGVVNFRGSHQGTGFLEMTGYE